MPCLTLRENTERPVTITDGTNVLVGTDPERILAGLETAFASASARAASRVTGTARRPSGSLRCCARKRAAQPPPPPRRWKAGSERRADRMPPLRVMHIVDRLQPGGMELGVIKLVNGSDPAEIASSICSTRPTVLRDLVRPDVPVFELNRRDGNDPRLVWALYRLFRRERPDIVHTHAWGTLLEGWSAARLARVPIVVHGEHGTLAAASIANTRAALRVGARRSAAVGLVAPRRTDVGRNRLPAVEDSRHPQWRRPLTVRFRRSRRGAARARDCRRQGGDRDCRAVWFRSRTRNSSSNRSRS